ncbi:cell division protein FtsB [Thermochromatium tepidum]|jgi:cell division protein FtsB|uniref:Cell division protein FtsB n=1 Tax=Thermochromatium tepidum ATCC 43061 TaxID=316276 RepID=A0A6I6E427_THETI|nr:cell division protein FtsB [Thermochromatium tepidum ATCC 43061]
MYWLILVLTLLLGALQYRLWVGEGSLAELHSLKREIALEESELERLRARNRALQAEVDDLREGSEAIEERARSELGMIKPGEIFIQVIERPRSANPEGRP